MKTLLLAAGKGTRLFPLTGEIPKPMAPVVNKPLIGHLFELLAGAGAEEVRVNVHHLADAILQNYGREARFGGMTVRFLREPVLTGTAGGAKRLAERLPEPVDEAFVVVMGDALTDVDVRAMVAFHRQRGAMATVALSRVTDTSRYGVVALDAEDNVVCFQEKPRPGEALSDLVNTGIYVLEPETLEHVPEEGFFDFAEDLFPRLLARGEQVVGYQGRFYWSDVGTLEAYRQAHYDALSGKAGVRIPGEAVGDGLWVDRGSVLHPAASLEGRVAVGRDVIVGRRATLAGNVTVGHGSWVLPGATVKNSVLLPEACVGEGAHVEDCVVGPGYYVSPGERIKGGTLMLRVPDPGRADPRSKLGARSTTHVGTRRGEGKRES